MDEVISAWTRRNNELVAMKLLGEAGIPAGAVLDTDELNKDVTFEQRGIMQTMVHPVHRPFKMPGWPVRVDGRPTRVTSSPALGEHTEQVLSNWLGLNAQAVASLRPTARSDQHRFRMDVPSTRPFIPSTLPGPSEQTSAS